MATVSGTVSEATGGKFANGAVSGAFQHMFNDEYSDAIANRVAYGDPKVREGNMRSVASVADGVSNVAATAFAVGAVGKNPLLMVRAALVDFVATTVKYIFTPDPYTFQDIAKDYLEPKRQLLLPQEAY